MSKLIDSFLPYATMSGLIPLFDVATAIEIVKKSEKEGINILGIDAIRVTEHKTQPFMEHSADYSTEDNTWQKAIAFLESKRNLNLLFEIITDD